ncbi:hypothetical protein Sme01_61290 [Sphaerisporangium melleum]|uniref:DUF397 domain-containing protein n=1 Tax=Sphaerisporangium melleum TaxID=321316 RepID=A0A917VM10_9ACTN|nr:hypothetical protein GCM10007964_44910 [Sphaerisporangium melleum]GII73653.1 hypothetical protein Sme01_61290 [Sphaerisporangium melleum]
MEAWFDGGTVWVRNSNDVAPDHPVIGVGAERWVAFLARVRAGELALERLGALAPAGEWLPVPGLLVSCDGRRVAVRADGGGPEVAFTLDEWRAFEAGARHDGEFTLDWLSAPATA